MMKVSIATGSWSHSGRITSYAHHLIHGLLLNRANPRIVAAGTVCNDWRGRLPFTADRCLFDSDINIVLSFHPVFRFLERQKELIGRVRQAGKPIVLIILDENEWLWNGALQSIQWLRPAQIVFPSEYAMEVFSHIVGDSIPSTTFHVYPIPYNRFCSNTPPLGRKAISTARIGKESRTHLLVDAGNIEIFAERPGIVASKYLFEMFGTGISDLQCYKGPYDFSKDALDKIYGSADVYVDMIKNDPMVRYSVLEAMDYGLFPILAADWPAIELNPMKHYYAASTIDEIREGIDFVGKNGNTYTKSNLDILKNHDAGKIVGEMIHDWDILMRR